MPPASTLQDKNDLFAQYQILEDLGDFPTYSLFRVKAPNGSIKLWKKVDLQFNSASIETRLLPVIEKVSHPYLNAVSGSFLFQDKGLLFVESEFPVKTLRHRLDELRSQAGGNSKTGIPISELFSYMSQASEGIDYLNTAQHAYQGKKIAIYHRALSPDSLHLFEEKGKIVCKVGDFGLAKPIIDNNEAARHSLGLTNYDYAPPEFDEGLTTNTSDQYSLATTYVELRTGRLPFTGSLLQKLQAQLSGNPDLSLLEPNERPVVARALNRDPQARFPSCREFMKQLQLALGGVVTVALPPLAGGGSRATSVSAAASSSSGSVEPAGAGGSLFGGSNTGWALNSRPVGRSGGALFNVGSVPKGPINTPAAKPEGFSMMNPAPVVPTAPKAAAPPLPPIPAPIAPKAPAVPVAAVPKTPAVPKVPEIKPEIKPATPVRMPTPAPSQSEGWSLETAQEKSNTTPEPAASNWTPGKVDATPSRPMFKENSSPEIKVTPPPEKPAIRPEAISNKARETLELIKRKQAGPAALPPPVEKPVPGAKFLNINVDSTGAGIPALPPTRMTGQRAASKTAGALGEAPAPPRPPNLPSPRRASTPSMGVPLPNRSVSAPPIHRAPSPIPKARRSSAGMADAAAAASSANALGSNLDSSARGFAPSWVTMLMVMIAAFCLGMMLLFMFQKK